MYAYKSRTDEENLKKICESLHKSIKNYDWDSISPELRVTATIGYSILNPNESPYGWLYRVTHALNKGKKEGGDCVISGPIFTGSIIKKKKRESEAERAERFSLSRHGVS